MKKAFLTALLAALLLCTGAAAHKPGWTITSSIQSGSTLSGTITWSASYKTSTKVAYTNFYVVSQDGTTVNEQVGHVTTRPPRISLDTTRYANGTYTFWVFGTAQDGHQVSDSDTATISNGTVTDPQPLGPSGTWNLAWRDEFDGDLSQWIIQGWGDQCTNSVSGGQLHQRMANAVEVNGCEIQSRFAASGDFVFEARMSYPATSDGHAAQHGGAWTHQQDGVGTTPGEIDLFESDNCFIHNGTGANAAGVGKLGYAGSMNTYTAEYIAATDTVTVWWNGQIVRDANGNPCQATNLGWDNAPTVFEFNQWVDTRCCPSVSNVSSDVEYARVWQH